ncbi:MAG: DUF1643 domain-containing protein [Bdellovibrionota bacterium]
MKSRVHFALSTQIDSRETILNGASFSHCGRYRYDLWRSFPNTTGHRTVAFVMLNPSTADAVKNDNTIRRCISFAHDWKCYRLAVVNLFAFRSSNPAGLANVEDPIGPDNDRFITHWIRRADLVIAAWGANKAVAMRKADVVTRLRNYNQIWCLGHTQDGSPRHPLYTPAGTRLVVYTGE